MNTLMGYCGPFKYDAGYCSRLKEYITDNLQWVAQQIEKDPDSPYWHQVIAYSWNSGVALHWCVTVCMFFVSNLNVTVYVLRSIVRTSQVRPWKGGDFLFYTSY